MADSFIIHAVQKDDNASNLISKSLQHFCLVIVLILRWVARENGLMKGSLKKNVDPFLVCPSRGKLSWLIHLQR